jgi:hypothetical protein
MEMNTETVEERKYEKSEEPEKIDETHTDRTIQHEKEEYRKKLAITRRQVRDLDKVKRPRPAFDGHKIPHTLTAPPPEEPLQPSENAKPSPIARKIPPVKSSYI